MAKNGLLTPNEMISAWQATLAKYELSRTTETDPKRKAFWTRNINRAKRTILALERQNG